MCFSVLCVCIVIFGVSVCWLCVRTRWFVFDVFKYVCVWACFCIIIVCMVVCVDIFVDMLQLFLRVTVFYDVFV